MPAAAEECCSARDRAGAAPSSQVSPLIDATPDFNWSAFSMSLLMGDGAMDEPLLSRDGRASWAMAPDGRLLLLQGPPLIRATHLNHQRRYVSFISSCNASSSAITSRSFGRPAARFTRISHGKSSSSTPWPNTVIEIA